MKKNILKYLLITTTIIGCVNTLVCESNANASTVIAADAIQEMQYFKDFFNAANTKDFFPIQDFLKKLAQYDSALEKFSEKNVEDLDANEIYDAIQAHRDSFPEEVLNIFGNQETFVKIVNEKIAQAIFYNLIKVPKEKMPRWSYFVDKITSLLQNNPQYTSFCKDLKSTRNITRFGFLKVKKILKKHLSKLPETIKKEAQEINQTTWTGKLYYSVTKK